MVYSEKATQGKYGYLISNSVKETSSAHNHGYIGLDSAKYRSVFSFPKINSTLPIIIKSVNLQIYQNKEGTNSAINVYIATGLNLEPLPENSVSTSLSGVGWHTISLDNLKAKIKESYDKKTPFYILLASEVSSRIRINGYQNLDKTYAGLVNLGAPTLTIEYELGESTGKINKTVFNTGDTATFTVTPLDASFKHQVDWYVGTTKLVTETLPSSKIQTEYTFSSSNVLKLFPETSSVLSGKVVLTTLDSSGTQIGNLKNYSFTLNLSDADGKPKLTALTPKALNAGKVTDVFLANYSSLQITLAAEAKGLATIKNYTVEIYSKTAEGDKKLIKTSTIVATGNAGNKYKTVIAFNNILKDAGDIYIDGTVTDSRGKKDKNDSTKTRTVNEYTKPTLSSVKFYRANDTGTQDDLQGEYIGCYFKYSFHTKLSGEYKIEIKLKSETNSTSFSEPIASTSSSGTIKFSKSEAKIGLEDSATVTVTITDSYGISISKKGVISLPAYLLHFRPITTSSGKITGTSLGIGSLAPTTKNNIQIGWATTFDKTVTLSSPLGVTSGGTGANTKKDACGNLNAVYKGGDTMSGKLIMGNGSGVAAADGVWTSFTYSDNAGNTRGSMMISNTNAWHVNVQETGSAYADRYRLPAPTAGKTSDTWYAILTTKNPVTVAQGGTGVTDDSALAAKIKSLLGVSTATWGDGGGVVAKNAIVINGMLIYTGITGENEVPNGATTSITISFSGRNFSNADNLFVMATKYHNNTASNLDRLDVFVQTKTAESMTVGVTNNTGDKRNVRISWLAIGPAATT